MNEKNQIPINVSTRIKNIKFIDFKLESIDETIKSKLDSSLFGFENSINFRIEPAIKQITLLFNVCVYTDEKKTIKLAELQTIGEFELLNFDDFRSGEQLALPNEASRRFYRRDVINCKRYADFKI
jgi:hypothetical protein